jgi:hypothetical protein
MSGEKKRIPSSIAGRAGDEGSAESIGQFLVYPAEDGRVKIVPQRILAL